MMEVLQEEKNYLHSRILPLYLVLVLLFGVLFIYLFNLQIAEGNENLFLSTTMKTSEVVVRAPRGLIYDRNDSLLVVNRPSFRLLVDLKELPEGKEKSVFKTLSEILGVEQEPLWRDFKNRAFTKQGKRVGLSQIVLLNDVDRDKIVSIYSRIDELPGVFVEVATTRDYVEGSSFSHLTGYVREVSYEEVNGGGYAMGDMKGATGLEGYYDDVLRGTNGRRILETNRDEIAVRELIPVEATSGKNVRISIDIKIQKRLSESLIHAMEKYGSEAGVAIIEDIWSGEIIALVSLPSFDPNKIVKGLSYSEAKELDSDPNLPLLNRAISLPQPPGSTFKTIVASSALQEDVIERETIFESKGCMDLGGGFEFCEALKRPLGKLDLMHGLSRSSNIYFCNTMLRLGIDRLNKYTDDFGLGRRTGIDLFGEQPGSVASKQLKENIQGEMWYAGDSCNTAIGQGLMEVTPLQMVGWVSAIANGGTYYKPHLATSILDENRIEEEKIKPEVLYTLSIEENHLADVREGMHLAVNDPWGSAFVLRGLSSDPAAKTGSAEDFRKVDGVFEKQAHSWITGFFPYESPQYAFVAYLEFGGWGFHSSEVIKEFLEWYANEYMSS